VGVSLGAGCGLGTFATGRGARGGGGSSGKREEGSAWIGKSYTAGSNATSGGAAISSVGGMGSGVLAATGGGLKARGALLWKPQELIPTAPASHSVVVSVL